MRRADPWLSAGLVKVGEPIYFVKWEADAARPTLQRIQSIGDVELFGINGSNYGALVLDRGPWEQRFGFSVDALAKGELAAAAVAAAAPPAVEQVRVLRSSERYAEAAVLMRNPNAGWWLPTTGLTITVYDAAGAILGVTSPSVVLGPGESRWVVANSISTGGGVPARAEVQLRGNEPWRPASTWPAPPLTVVQSAFRPDQYFPKVVGQIKNDGSVRIGQVRLVVLLWDAQGALLDADYSFESAIEPGQTVAFENTVSVPRGATVARVEVQPTAEGISALR
jgi:hypothetical protein